MIGFFQLLKALETPLDQSRKAQKLDCLKTWEFGVLPNNRIQKNIGKLTIYFYKNI